MRIGYNPHRDQPLPDNDYFHQVVIPVYIPHFENYFKESFQVLQLCLESLFQTVHNKTFITLVNNGSCDVVKDFLNQLYIEGKVHEVIHTTNIGKVNAILKGLVGHKMELVTISDADVLFLANWQNETVKVFNKVSKVGVVGIVPQFCSFKSKSENTIMANLFTNKLQFIPVKNPKAMIRFYDSIGWDRNYNEDYLKYTLGLNLEPEFKVILGSGHFVSTFKRTVLQNIDSFLPFKLGGPSESYLDGLPLDYDFWRVTTYDNYAYHIGNVPEDWMWEIVKTSHNNVVTELDVNFEQIKNKKKWFRVRNKMFKSLMLNKIIMPLLYKKWGLPQKSIKNF